MSASDRKKRERSGINCESTVDRSRMNSESVTNLIFALFSAVTLVFVELIEFSTVTPNLDWSSKGEL